MRIVLCYPVNESHVSQIQASAPDAEIVNAGQERIDELLPTAREYGRGHTAIIGVVLGMAVMAVSLLLL